MSSSAARSADRGGVFEENGGVRKWFRVESLGLIAAVGQPL